MHLRSTRRLARAYRFRGATRRPLLMALLVAAACLAAMSGSAPASRGIRYGGLSVFTASGTLTLSNSITCEVSVGITSNAPMTKTIINSQGAVTGTVWSCRGAATSGDFLDSPGARLYFRTFSGTLPNISAINIDVGDGSVPFGIALNIITCVGIALYGGPADSRLDGVIFTFGAGGTMTSVDFSSSEALSRHTGTGALCPVELTIRGRLTTFVSGTPRAVLE